MKRIIILWVELCLLISVVSAGSISGKLIDKSSHNAVEFANVSVFSVSDNKLIKGTSSGIDGIFTLLQIPIGKYLLKIAYVGYSTIEIPFQIAPHKSDLQLGSITLSQADHVLQQVEISGRKSQVSFEIDRKVYNVEQNAALAGASATEIMRNIPSLEVAADGTILLRNNKNVMVWINGRPSGLNEDNMAQILEQLPAETIEKIEVITNPSAKYSPDGTGIVNIILKKVNKGGKSGSVTAGVDTNAGRNAALNYFYISPRWEINLNGGYRNEIRKMFFNSDRYTFNQETTDTIVRYSRDQVKISGDGFFARLSTTYHATAKDHITIGGMVTTAKRMVTERTTNERIKDDIETFEYRNADSPTDRQVYNMSFDFMHEFNKKGHEIRAFAEYSITDAWGDQEIVQMDAQKNVQYYQWKTSDANRFETTLQADYTYPVNDHSTIELGYKGEFLDKKSSEMAQYGLTVAKRIDQPELSNIFKATDYRNSFYLNYTSKAGKLKYQAGLRGEYNQLKNTSTLFDTSGNDSAVHFNNNYPGIYPTLFLDYDLTNNNKLQLNYTRRINRPKGRMNNPFRSVADSANIEFGNPDLTPEYSNAFEISHIKTWDDHMLSTVLYYRTTRDVMLNVNYVETQGNYDIKFITVKNITNSKAAGLELMLKNRLFKVLDLTTSMNLYYNHLDGFEYVGTQYDASNTFGWNGRLIANLTLSGGFVAQVSGGYQSRRASGQGESLPVWGIDAGLRKSFFNKRLLINLTARDIVNSRLNRDVTSGYNYYDYSESKLNARALGLVVTYNFGSLTKKTDKSRENDNPFGGDF